MGPFKKAINFFLTLNVPVWFHNHSLFFGRWACGVALGGGSAGAGRAFVFCGSKICSGICRIIVDCFSQCLECFLLFSGISVLFLPLENWVVFSVKQSVVEHLHS